MTDEIRCAGPPPLPVVMQGGKQAWNGWWTLLWCVALLVTWQVVQVVLMVVVYHFDRVTSPGETPGHERMLALQYDGDVLGVVTLLSALVVCPLCYLVGRCKGGWNGWEYLGFRRVGWPKVLFWVLVTFLCGLGFNVAAPHLGVDATPEFMVRVAESTQYPVLMVLGIVVGAPLVEEFVFRGVVFRGWAASGMGPWLTIALTSLMWTALHVQYDVVVLAWLFLLGLLIGYVRHRTGSIWGPLVMHAFNNALASVEIMHLIA